MPFESKCMCYAFEALAFISGLDMCILAFPPTVYCVKIMIAKKTHFWWLWEKRITCYRSLNLWRHVY